MIGFAYGKKSHISHLIPFNMLVSVRPID